MSYERYAKKQQKKLTRILFISNWLSSILGVLTFTLSKGPGVDGCSDTTVVKRPGFFGV